MVASLGAAACGGVNAAAPQTPAQLLASSSKTFQKFSTFHVTGGFIVGSSNDVFLDETVLQVGDATGTLTIGSSTVDFVVAKQTSYFNALPAFVTAGISDPVIAVLATRLIGMHWWQTSGSMPVSSALAFDKRSAYVDRFFSGRAKLTASPHKDSRGRSAIRLTDGSVTVFVATAAPHDVLEITTAPHYLAVDLSSVDLIFDKFNASATVTPPASFVTPTADQMPAFFHVNSLDFDGQCDRIGCPVKATVYADAGSGTAAVDFVVSDSNHHTLGTCKGRASVSAQGGTATARCRATGSRWTSFWYTGGTYSVGATAENPDYST
jgi:hypothetical protein